MSQKQKLTALMSASVAALLAAVACTAQRGHDRERHTRNGAVRYSEPPIPPNPENQYRPHVTHSLTHTGIEDPEPGASRHLSVGALDGTPIDGKSHWTGHRDVELEHAARHLVHLLAEEHGPHAHGAMREDKHDGLSNTDEHALAHPESGTKPSHLHKTQVAAALAEVSHILHARELEDGSADSSSAAGVWHPDKHVQHPSHPADFHPNPLPENPRRTAAPK